MTILYRFNQSIDLNLAEYSGAVTIDAFKATAEWAGANPQHLRRDSLAIILPGTSFATIDLAALDALFAQYRKLYEPHQFHVLRRSAWICQSLEVQPYIDHWLEGASLKSTSSTVRQFSSFEEAGEWLVLNPREIAAVQSGEGFTEIARF